MKINQILLTVGLSFGLQFSALALTEAESSLHTAAAAGNSEQVVLALLEADPDVRNAQGLTPLMLAARSGNFESVRRLLWSGADPNLKSKDGKLARDFLSKVTPEFTETNLILRAYAFVKTHGKQNGKATAPELTIISDNYIDHDHPMLKGAYRVNQAEQRGRPGTDDDGNGFVDDVYGWDLAEDTPERRPELAIDDSPETKKFLEQLMKDYSVAQGAEGFKAAKAMESRLKNSYDNPLVRQIGKTTLAYGGINLNDYTYASMLHQSSHGTHVAGIVLKESDGAAKIVGTSWGGFGTRDAKIFQQIPRLISLAERSETYAEFVESVVEIRRGKALSIGKRSSQFIKATGAGVANMSWGRPLTAFNGWAENLEVVYKEKGKNPDTIKNASSAGKLDLIDNLPLELLVSDAALFALVIHENPDTLFIIAAGNENSDNDQTLPSPNYLSRFFPNVITVASHGPTGKFSRFSNRGVRSVSLAAPGEAINSAYLAGLSGPMNGTSMAAPAVAGVAAKIRSKYPKLSAYDIRQILESTVTVEPNWKDLLITSGKMNKSAALAMAGAWSSGNAAVLLDEVRRATREVEKRQAAAPQPTKGSNAPKLTDPAQFPITSGQGALNLTQVKGNNSGWISVMQVGSKTPKTKQIFNYAKRFPIDWVKAQWDKGYRITDVGGSSGAGWAVTMSTGVKGNQRTVGFAIDQEAIVKHMEAGFRITSVSGWDKNWLIVMDTETGWGKQRFSLPGPFDQRRIDWLGKRWQEGYRITSIAGDDLPNIDDDGYMFVMTLESGLDAQKVFGPGAWPNKEISEHAKQGYAITAVAGSPGRWLVTVSSKSGITNQATSAEGPIAPSFIKANW